MMDLAAGPTTAAIESMSSGIHLTTAVASSNESLMWPAICGNDTLWVSFSTYNLFAICEISTMNFVFEF